MMLKMKISILFIATLSIALSFCLPLSFSLHLPLTPSFSPSLSLPPTFYPSAVKCVNKSPTKFTKAPAPLRVSARLFTMRSRS